MSAATPKHQFLWFDLETTGLDPHECSILEWAAVLAEDDRDGDMTPVHEYTAVVKCTESKLHFELDDYVRRMHTKNGLLTECLESDAVSLEESDAFLYGLAEELAGPKPKGIVLAGASVHFDLSFVRVHLPRFASCLSHRVFDVSTLKAAERIWGDDFANIKSDIHRALPDALASLAEVKALRERWERNS